MGPFSSCLLSSYHFQLGERWGGQEGELENFDWQAVSQESCLCVVFRIDFFPLVGPFCGFYLVSGDLLPSVSLV